MFKLIKLEWKKNNIKKYIRNVIIMTVVLSILILAAAGELVTDEIAGMYNNNIVFISVEMFTHISFMTFTSTMLSAFIVSPYKDKTMELMFMYPIKRQKIFLSQMLSVWCFNFFALIIAKIIILGILALIGHHVNIWGFGTNFSNPFFYCQIAISSAIMISVCYIALLVGLRMKSSKATIVTTVILVCLTQGNIGTYTLANNIPFYILLMVLSIFAVIKSVYKIELKDV